MHKPSDVKIRLVHVSLFVLLLVEKYKLDIFITCTRFDFIVGDVTPCCWNAEVPENVKIQKSKEKSQKSKNKKQRLDMRA